MNEIFKWSLLRKKVEEASEMNPGDTGRGMKNAYCSVLKLMDMLDHDEELDDVVFENGLFKKTVNILSL